MIETVYTTKKVLKRLLDLYDKYTISMNRAYLKMKQTERRIYEEEDFGNDDDLLDKLYNKLNTITKEYEDLENIKEKVEQLIYHYENELDNILL